MTSSGESENRSEYDSIWIAIAVLLVAAILRIYAIGREGLWCDEAYTALTVRMPLPELISMLFRVDDAPPLYYLLQKWNVALAGDSESALRAVSAGAGILSVAVLLWVARRRRSSGDFWGACFLAIATTGVFHARQARSYGLLLFFALVLVLSSRHLLQGGRRGGLILAISACGLCLTHHVGVVLVLTSLLLWPIGASARPRIKSWALLHGPALVISASLWISASAQLGVHAKLNAWIAHYWETHAILLAPFYSLGLFLPVGLPISQLSVGFATPGSVSTLWIGLSIILGVACLIAAGIRARRGYGLPGSQETTIETGLLLLPLIALVGASLVMTPVYVLGRTDVLAYPAFVLLIGRGLAGLPWRRAPWLLLAFWGAMSWISLAPSYGLWNKALAKGTDRQLAQHLVDAGLAETDWIVHTFMTSPTIEYYLDRLEAPHRTAWFPLAAGENTASGYPAPPDSLDSYLEQASRLVDKVSASLPEHGDVWIFGLIAPATVETIATIRESGIASTEQIAYPVGLLVYALVGRGPVTVAFQYHQDWVAGDRVVLRVPRSSWLPRDEIPPTSIEIRP